MKIKAGIIGTGNIGTDLLMKMIKSTTIEPVIFVGRRPDSDGILTALLKHNINISMLGIQYFINTPKCCDVVFDCTNAFDAVKNNEVFQSQGIKVIDMTPAKIGDMCVPIINGDIIKTDSNVNMITCGGQTSIPILNLISQCCSTIDYIEIVSQIASKSAGIATRANLDQYIHFQQRFLCNQEQLNNQKDIQNVYWF
jgi:acetaldehyde dehydrogenase